MTRRLIALLALFLAPALSAAQDPPPLFTDLVVVGADPVTLGDAGWGDLDSDGLLDLVVSGNMGTAASPVPVLQVLLNTGDTFVEVPDPEGGDTPIQVPATRFERSTVPDAALWRSAVVLFDFDGDGDLDAAVTGQDAGGAARLAILQNEGGTLFVRWLERGVRDGDADAADLDGDGAPDLVLAGAGDDGRPVVRIFRNRTRAGEGFVEIAHGIPGYMHGSVEAADFDLDGDNDLLLVGTVEPQSFRATVFVNEGGAWTDLGAGLPALVFGHAAWGDYDADGDPDILGIGARFGPLLFQGAFYVFENAGGTFVDRSSLLRGRFPEENVRGRYLGTAGFAEFDGDGLLDVFLTGSIQRTRIEPGRYYMTGGDPGWNQIPRDAIDGGHSGRTYVGDHDADGDVDLMTVGTSSSAGAVIRIQRNGAPRPDINVPRRNRPPSAPPGLVAEVQGSDVVLRWEPGSDPDTPAAGLTYEVRVGSAPGSGSIVGALSAPSGRRLTARFGNAGGRRFLRLADLAPGTYWWSVQAVDAAFAGSPFAAEASFVVQ